MKEIKTKFVDPLDDETIVTVYNEVHSDSKMNITYLTIEEIKKLSGVTDEQIKQIQDAISATH